MWAFFAPEQGYDTVGQLELALTSGIWLNTNPRPRGDSAVSLAGHGRDNGRGCEHCG